MWVLSTARAELRYFSDCAAVVGGYAILSHTWTQDPAGEQTFQDVQDIIKECKITGTNPRECVGEKIRRCCELAEGHGYDWVWIDSCCIDKTSSTELSEAINSMFNWYALAEVCYVYLEDVPSADDPHAKNSKFLSARWHSRGWTLQELLAPAFLVFFSKDWENIGTKYDLRVPLSRCTGINKEYLTRERDFRVHASIATRMSWAAKRKTTRVEDEAYCLLGLFDVNMPTLYGEGQHAFQRLQAELARRSTDATLFAWGDCHGSSNDKWEQKCLSKSQRHKPNNPDTFLFAVSPIDFIGWSNTYSSLWKHSSALRPPPPQKSQLGKEAGLLEESCGKIPSFDVTSYGMKCHLPMADIGGATLALLPCQRNGEPLALLLHPALTNETETSSHQLYYVSWLFHEPTRSGSFRFRLASLGSDAHNLRFRGKSVFVTWRDVYIAAHPPTTGRRDGAHLLQHFIPDVAPSAFRIPRTLMQTLGALSFFPVTRVVSWDPASKDTMRFGCLSTKLLEHIRILLGTCTKASTEAHPCHWAWADQSHSATWAQSWPKYVHDCATDHITTWPNGVREFGDAERTIRLAFSPCMHAPERTLVLGLELSGSRYEEIQKNANIRLPPPVSHPDRRIDVTPHAALPRLTNGLNAMPAFTSSVSNRPASTPLQSSVGPCSDHIQTVDYSSTTAIQALADDLQDMAITKPIHAGSDEAHDVARACASCGMANTPSNLYDALQQIRENDAARARETQEMKDEYDTQICTLTTALESQRTELSQLKALVAQMLQNNNV